jgi:predicted transcriptional regulator
MCENGARKTHVMYRCNLNSKQINQYLQFLLDCGMLERNQEYPSSKRHIYKTSRLGQEFIGKYAFQRANIQVDDEFLITRFHGKNRSGPLVYKKGKGVVLAGSPFINDLDSGLQDFFPHLLYDKKIYCYYQPEIHLRHYMKYKSELKDVHNDFTKMAKGIDHDTSPIMTIYHLK